MKKRTLTIAAGLTLMAGLLLVSGVAWANPNTEPVWGQVVSFRVTDPGEYWIDGDGVRHWRDKWVRTRYVGDIGGVFFCVFGASFDPSTGDGNLHGSFVFNGYVGEDWVSATGRFVGVASGPPTTWVVDFVWHLDDGRLIQMTEVQPGDLEPPWDYVGEILDPPGH